MAKPREVKRRIRSVQNTKKITKTMELVSTSKLKRAQDRVVGARPYAQALAEVIGQLYSPELAERFPLLRQPGYTGRGAGVRRAALLLITSNRGLCGAFNANLIREARRRLEELEKQDAHTELHLVGKKGISYFKFTKRNIASQRIDIGDRPTLEHGARRTAMKNATDAGSDMLTILQRTFNRARQAQITQELAEIVGGAEALKG